MSAGRGRFIVFEGGEGSGKSTQAARLAARIGAVLTREPGGTEIGSGLRSLLLASAEHPEPMAARAEALLMAADRAQHAAEVLRPALGRGTDVVCDRYIPSTVAYQGAGRGLDVAELTRISRWAVEDLTPDLVVLLEVPEDVSAERTGAARDRIEAAGVEFHRRVAQSFRHQAAADPQRWVVVDGVGDPDEIAERIWQVVVDRWPDRQPGTEDRSDG